MAIEDVLGRELTEGEHVAFVKAKAQELVEALNAAIDSGVSHAVLLPELVVVFREAGMLPQ